MALEEKNAWFMGVIAILAYGVYVVLILGAAGSDPVHTVDYIPALIATIGAAILANVILNIAVSIVSPRSARKKDGRDREIYRFGESGGQAFVIAGALGALILAMLQVEHFWIANEIYLAFVVSALFGTMTRLGLYRRGF